MPAARTTEVHSIKRLRTGPSDFEGVMGPFRAAECVGTKIVLGMRANKLTHLGSQARMP